MQHYRVCNSEFVLLDPGNTVAEGTVPSRSGQFVYEPATTTLLLNALRRGGTFCDIGALHGYFSCLVAAVEPRCIVHAFEPNPIPFDVLARNFAANGVRGFPHRVAVNADGSDLHFAGRSVVDEATEGAIVVPGMRFDDFAERTRLRDAVLKIDVHGAEGLVFDGMGAALRDCVSDVLLEVHARPQLVGDYDYGYFLEALEEAGFQVYEVADFRDAAFPVLTPLSGDARADFADYARWKPEHEQLQRMLFATRDDRGF